MKNILFIFTFIITISCFGQKKETTAAVNEDGDLVGIANKENFLVEPFNEWFSYNYKDYEVNEEIVDSLKPLLKKVTIKAFMGTWCSDSQEQTPVFYKILDVANFNYKNLELVTVNSDKKTTDNLENGFDIERVPTFIFYREDHEIGRFVEYPRESVEADMLKIVSGEPYKHSYEED